LHPANKLKALNNGNVVHFELLQEITCFSACCKKSLVFQLAS